ncbi:MAG TPA: cell division protein ZapA [Limnochordales bacterium]
MAAQRPPRRPDGLPQAHSTPDRHGGAEPAALARVRVQVAGEEYVLRGNMSPQRLTLLAQELDRRLRELTARYPRLPFHQAAVLCCLQLLEELQQLRDENRELRDLLGRRP